MNAYYWSWRLLLGATGLAALAVLTLLPVVPGDGWPGNHENPVSAYNSFYLRTLVYAKHMQQGDWFPIWSAADNDGLGSPQPLMYHKLFYLLSGALYALSGHMKLSILVSLWSWLMIGACGTYALCRALGCGRWLAWCGGAMLLMANYTVTNWLIRGAMAEFAAAMLLPWVLATFVVWLECEQRRYRVSGILGLLIGLEFLAHSILAFYLVLLLGMSTLLLLLGRQVPLRRLAPGPLIWAGVTFALVAGPYLAAMYVIGSDFDMSRFNSHPAYVPERQIQPLPRYAWDTVWRWGQTWQGYTVQLDTAVVGLLAFGLAMLVVHRVVHPTGHVSSFGKHPGASALVLVCVLSLLLQTAWAVPFYRHVPGAAFLQFPWRLLAVLTPGLIALSLWLWRWQPTWLAVPSTLGSLAAMAWFSGVWAPIQYDHTYSELQLAGLRFSAFNEYVPVKASTEAPYTPTGVAKMLMEAGCDLAAGPPPAPHVGAQEALVRDFEMRCREAGTYPLPLFGSTAHAVQISGPDENGTESKRCATAAGAPTLCAVTLGQAGSYRIRITMPTFAGFLVR